ncbi:hypothetical protein VB712_19200 [Spirulina sp. CCNP1310]|uniref:hypothetical protein n=1 Tax=Spirulina sp. CCNP1310 TaxID=3110249 RepID=UPI002B1EB87C|nr:hypothetical protein [Spirulina sp. CCNP1310]MEA5421357.1 hypothetical protein [Spirulina sp. CCNP1310]
MEETTFRSKYMISWLVMSTVLGIIGIFYEPNIAVLFLALIAGFSFGFLGMLIDAAANYSWKFNEIKQPIWVWHIYPIYSITVITIGMIWGIISNSFRSR